MHKGLPAINVSFYPFLLLVQTRWMVDTTYELPSVFISNITVNWQGGAFPHPPVATGTLYR
jgi:hypothetical protein